MKQSALLLCVVYFVTIAFVLLCVFLVPLPKTDIENEGQQRPTRNQLRSAVPATDEAKRDCSNEMVFSVLDAQCQVVCQGPETYISRNGICVNAITQNSTAVRNECSAKNGVLAYLIGDPQFGKADLLCLSVDPGIQPNDPTKPNEICKNGTIDVDYRKQYPSLDQCKCPPSMKLVRIPATGSIREHGVCVANALADAINEATT